MKLVVGSTFAIVSILAGAAHAGKPGWCPTVKDQSSSTWSADEDVGSQIFELMTSMCEDPDAGGYADDMAKWTAARSALMKKLEWTDAEWNDAAVWTAAPYPTMRTAPTFKVDDDKKAWSKYDAIEQFMAIGGAMETDDATYLADALGAKLTETGKLGYIEQCLHAREDERPVMWALCSQDVASFDPAKVVAELKADQAHTGYERTLLRLELYKTRGELAAHDKDVKALSAKDDAYAKMFAIAAQTRKDWDAHVAGRQALLDLEMQMDDARVTKSRKALAGCEDATWKAWIAAVSAIPAKRFEHMHTDVLNGKRFSEDAMAAITAEPDGYLAGAALYRCHADDSDRDYTIRMIGETLERWPGFRGPRTATTVGIMNAGLQLDDKDAHLDFPAVRNRGFGRNGGSSGGTGGALASVKTSGAKTHMTFVTKMHKEEECTKYKESNRVTRIRDDGTLEYESTCLATKMVEVNDTPNPYDVDSRYAAAMKPGAVVEVTESVVDAVWPKSGASMPSAVFGAPVK